MITSKMYLTDTGMRFLDPKDGAKVRRSFPIGHHLEVTIRTWSDSRSARQRRTIHGIWQRMAEYYQCSMEDVKLLMKYLFGQKVTLGDIEENGPPEWAGQWYNPTRSPLAKMHPNLEDRFWYLMSEAAYSMTDERMMIDAMINYCFAADIDISEILEGMEKEKAK